MYLPKIDQQLTDILKFKETAEKKLDIETVENNSAVKKTETTSAD